MTSQDNHEILTWPEKEIVTWNGTCNFGGVPNYRLKDPDDIHTGPEDMEIRCRLCDLKGSEETPYHLLKDCLAVWEIRRDYFGTYTLENEEYINWSLDALLGFFKTIDLENKA